MLVALCRPANSRRPLPSLSSRWIRARSFSLANVARYSTCLQLVKALTVFRMVMAYRRVGHATRGATAWVKLEHTGIGDSHRSGFRPDRFLRHHSVAEGLRHRSCAGD